MKSELPDDIDLLKAMVVQHQSMLKQQQAPLRTYAGQVAGYELVERLKAPLDKLKRQLFAQSSEKLRNKLEKKIRDAEKRLGEIEDRLNNAKGCLEAAAAVTAQSDVDGVQEEPADEPTSPLVLHRANRCRRRCRAKRYGRSLPAGSAMPSSGATRALACCHVSW